MLAQRQGRTTRPGAGWQAVAMPEEPRATGPLRPIELAIYKIAGVDERHEQHAVTYTVAVTVADGETPAQTATAMSSPIRAHTAV